MDLYANQLTSIINIIWSLVLHQLYLHETFITIFFKEEDIETNYYMLFLPHVIQYEDGSREDDY